MVGVSAYSRGIADRRVVSEVEMPVFFPDEKGLLGIVADFT